MVLKYNEEQMLSRFAGQLIVIKEALISYMQSRPLCKCFKKAKGKTGGAAVLSEEKIKKMIRLSDYENGLGGTDLRRTRYIKTDYVRLQVIKTVISVIIAGCLAALLFVIYHINEILYQPASFPWKTYFLTGGVIWVIFLALGCVFTCIRTSRLYAESKERVKEYDTTLHDLLELYDEEEQEGKMT